MVFLVIYVSVFLIRFVATRYWVFYLAGDNEIMTRMSRRFPPMNSFLDKRTGLRSTRTVTYAMTAIPQHGGVSYVPSATLQEMLEHHVELMGELTIRGRLVSSFFWPLAIPKVIWRMLTSQTSTH